MSVGPRANSMSLTKYAIEEAYEVEAAIRQGDINEIRNEWVICYYKWYFNRKCLASRGVQFSRCG